MDRTERLVQLLRGSMHAQPIHPGEILREEFLRPLGKSPATLERELGLSDGPITALCDERTRIDGRLATLLARVFATTPGFWLELQRRHDLEVARDHGP